MMDERKVEPAHSRLYKKGKEKIRNQTMLAIQQNTKSMHNLNIDKIIKEDIKEEMDDMREDLPINAKAQPDSRRTKKGLHELHKDRQAELERKRDEQESLRQNLANYKFKNPESEQMVINAFKKEFR